MVTHTCPQEIKTLVLNDKYLNPKMDKTITEVALQVMWETYQPKLWVFGHFHTRFDKLVNGTRFVCLDEFQTMDVTNETIT
jgi:hypothetical protein